MNLPIIAVILELDTPLYFSDGSYVSLAADAIGQQVFKSRLVGAISYERAVRCRLWGDTRPAGGLGVVELINTDGALDALPTDTAVKGKRVRIYTGAMGLPFDQFELAASARIDRVEANGEQSVRVITTDLMLVLDSALQPDLYETADAVAGEVINRPRPIAVGHPKNCPIPLVDAIDYEYDCHDNADWRDVTMVRDGGYPLTLGTGYIRAITAGRFGIEKLALPVGRVVADIRGAAAVTEIIGADPGDFAAGLTGWSTSVTGDGVCAAESGGCRISGGAAGTAKIFIASTLLLNRTYRWSIASATRTSGDLVIISGADVVATLTATGAASGYFTADADEAFGIAKGSAAASWLIDGVRLERLDQHALLGDVVRYLIGRSDLSLADIDDTSLDALEAACPWPISLWADGSVRIRDALQMALDSFCGWVYENRAGELAFGRPTRPAEGTPAFTITREMVVAGTELRIAPDEAPGFSRIVAGSRNWYRYGSGEVVDGVSDADRTLITADYRVRARSVASIGDEINPIVITPLGGPRLSPIDDADTGSRGWLESDVGIGTLLDLEADCQSLADYIAGLYPVGERQRFYTLDCYIREPDLGQLGPGDIVTLQYPRFGFDAGVPLLVVGIKGAIGQQRVQLTLWGAPEATP